eukprot:641601-Prorocentrum_minimum.AAC.2
MFPTDSSTPPPGTRATTCSRYTVWRPEGGCVEESGVSRPVPYGRHHKLSHFRALTDKPQ